jgi:hypothetical protein
MYAVYAGTDIVLHTSFPKVKKLPNTIVTTGSPSSKLSVNGSRTKTEPAMHGRPRVDRQSGYSIHRCI